MFSAGSGNNSGVPLLGEGGVVQPVTRSGELLAQPTANTMGGMRTFGRALQWMGLVILPLAMVMELTGGLGRRFGVSDMVLMLGYGVISFVLGRMLEGLAGRKS